MSYVFVPPVDDALDTNIHDLDSFELSDDEHNMLQYLALLAVLPSNQIRQQNL